MKICSKCKLEKSVNEFYKHPNKSRGINYWCKDCCKTYQTTPERQEYYQRPEIKQRKKEHRQKPEFKFKTYKHNAKNRGYCFDFSLEQFTNLIQQDCHYCGQTGPNGIDRKNNDEGYTFNNSVACCTKCNHMKWDLTVKEMFSHILKMLKHTFKGWAFIQNPTSKP